MLERYIEILEKVKRWMTIIGYSETTIEKNKTYLRIFFTWLIENTITLEKITTKDILLYSKYIHQKPLSSGTIQLYFRALKILDNYYQKNKNKKILKLELIKIESSIKTEKETLTIEEIEKIYREIEESHQGMLEKVIVALFYGCGLRLSEGLDLKLENLDFKNNVLEIESSKNKTNRFIPLTFRIKKDLENYIKYTRPITQTNSKRVLININTCNPLREEIVRKKIKRMVKKAGIEKRITTHNFRHSIATHLLEQGMKIEQIAQFLGHKSLSATQTYTRYGKI